MKLIITDKPRATWARYMRDRHLSMAQIPIFTENTRFFTIGSCFASEIRWTLRAMGLSVFPKYRTINFYTSRQFLPMNRFDHFSSGEAFNHYNTFSIRYEFEKYLGEWRGDEKDFWEIPTPPFLRKWSKNTWTENTVWQYPFRRNLFAKDKPSLAEIVGKVDMAVKEGIANSNVFIITLGLTETWRTHDSNKVICQYPGYSQGGGFRHCYFQQSSFEENLQNIRKTCRVILDLSPENVIILTVSPVPLDRTFTGQDIYVANQQSKATLLSVARQIQLEFERVYYFPSYELVVNEKDSFKEDGRHVKDILVQIITASFLMTYGTEFIVKRVQEKINVNISRIER